MAEKEYTTYGCVYVITNSVNGKIYVGQTTRAIASRWSGHVCGKRRGCPLLYAAISKYGKESFSIEAIAYADTQDELDRVEVMEILSRNSGDRDFGYNIAKGGSGGKQSQETIALRVSKTKGMKRSQEFKDRISAVHTGKTLSNDAKAYLSNIAKNRPPASLETRGKLSKAAAGRRWSEVQRAKMIVSATGKTHSEETKRKLSEIFSGRSRSAEAIRKTAIKNSGKKRSDETKLKMSESRKMYWVRKRLADAAINEESIGV